MFGGWPKQSMGLHCMQAYDDVQACHPSIKHTIRTLPDVGRPSTSKFYLSTLQYHSEAFPTWMGSVI
jgi:hypothetical protein